MIVSASNRTAVAVHKRNLFASVKIDPYRSPSLINFIRTNLHSFYE